MRNLASMNSVVEREDIHFSAGDTIKKKRKNGVHGVKQLSMQQATCFL